MKMSVRAYQTIQALRKKLDGKEVSMFGIVPQKGVQLYVSDVVVPAQVVTGSSANPSDEAIADMLASAVAAGLQPWQISRVWIHTHPTFAPTPSGTDEQTYARIFTGADWGLMLILGQVNHKDEWFARMTLTDPFGRRWDCPETVEVDWTSTESLRTNEEIERLLQNVTVQQVQVVSGGNWADRNTDEELLEFLRKEGY